ncbi:MAG: hypothetical protein BGO12_21345 [Verrucomicrobia bacterium 61-8]|nr:recombinase family protein [Verrucomicrobiota bacterium]OJU98040.1 MAG: hypothetical protein BGO12_21345 [Verrucomicrobia bacterium 61-8]
MKAYSYIRFSTTRQADGDSLRRQLELSERYAAKHNLEIDDSLRITDLGKSAYTGKHLSEGALGAFLKAVEAGKVEPGSFLLVESLDRLSRAAVPKALRLFLTLLEHGVHIVTLADERKYSEESVSKDMTEMIISIAIMSRAHEESLRKAERLAEAWAEKRKKIGEEKLTSMCPRWLKLSEDRKHYELIPERAKVVREIFDLTLQGVGRSALAKRLNDRKEPAWTKGKRLKDGWHHSYIAKILANPAVIGRYQPHVHKDGKKVPVGEEISDYFPAVVAEASYYTLKGRYQPRGRYGGVHRVNNLFTNLVFDGRTGDIVRYVCVTDRKRKHPWRSLMSDAKRLNPKAQIVGWSYPHFEAAFLKFISELDWNQVTQQEQNTLLLDKEREANILRGKLEEVEARLEKFAEAIASSEEKPAFMIKKIAETEAEGKALESQLTEVIKAIRKLERAEQGLRQDQDKIRKLVAENDGHENRDVRLRLREEIRRKVKTITIYPERAGSKKNPSFMVEFVNGCTTWVRTSPVAIGTKATSLNSDPKVVGVRFQPSGDAPSPLDGMIIDPEDRGDED